MMHMEIQFKTITQRLLELEADSEENARHGAEGSV